MQFGQLKRRELITLLGGAAASSFLWPLAAHAQQERMRRVGVLVPLIAPGGGRVAAFQEQLQKLGWIDGRNVQFDVRWSGGDAELAAQHALELAALAPDVIVIQSTLGLRALRAVDRTVPVVLSDTRDLVEIGIVDSLAHPGGNTTGFTFSDFSVGGKWLELLKTMAPHLTRVLNIYHPDTDGHLAPIEANAPTFAVQAVRCPVRSRAELKPAIEAFAREPNGGLIVHTHPLIGGLGARQIIDLATEHALPAMYPYVAFVRQGGLICYGIDWIESFRNVAGYVDLIL